MRSRGATGWPGNRPTRRRPWLTSPVCPLFARRRVSDGVERAGRFAVALIWCRAEKARANWQATACGGTSGGRRAPFSEHEKGVSNVFEQPGECESAAQEAAMLSHLSPGGVAVIQAAGVGPENAGPRNRIPKPFLAAWSALIEADRSSEPIPRRSAPSRSSRRKPAVGGMAERLRPWSSILESKPK